MKCEAEKDIRLLFIGVAFAAIAVIAVLRFLVSGTWF